MLWDLISKNFSLSEFGLISLPYTVDTLIIVMSKSITHNIGDRSLNSTIQNSATCVSIVEFNVIGAPLLPFFYYFIVHFIDKINQSQG